MRQPRPVLLGADLGHVVVSRTVNDEKLAFLLRAVVDGASHPIGDDEIAVTVDHGDGRRQSLDPSKRIEVHARDQSPNRIEAWNEHPSGHVLGSGERRLQHQSSGSDRHRELSRDGGAQRVAEENESVGRNAESIARELKRGERVPGRSSIGRHAGQAVVSAIFGEDDTKICSRGRLFRPRNEPSRDVGIAVKDQHDRTLAPAFADDVREQVNAIGRRVIDATSLRRPSRRGHLGDSRRLEDHTFLKAPQQEQEGDVTEPKADQDPRGDLSHSRSCQRSAGSSVETRRAI